MEHRCGSTVVIFALHLYQLFGWLHKTMIGLKGTKLHYKSPTAEWRYVLCVGVGGDRTHAARPQGSRVCPPWPLGHGLTLQYQRRCCFTSNSRCIRFIRYKLMEKAQILCRRNVTRPHCQAHHAHHNLQVNYALRDSPCTDMQLELWGHWKIPASG